MNRPDEAIATYQKAIRAQPAYYSPYFELGLFYYRRGEFPEAEKYFRRHHRLRSRSLPRAHGSGPCAQRSGASSGGGAISAYGTASTGKLQDSREPWLPLLSGGALRRKPSGFSKRASAPRRTPSRMAMSGDAYRHLDRPQEAAKAYRTAQAMAESQVAQNPREPFTRAATGSLVGAAWRTPPGRVRDCASAQLELRPDQSDSHSGIDLRNPGRTRENLTGPGQRPVAFAGRPEPSTGYERLAARSTLSGTDQE